MKLKKTKMLVLAILLVISLFISCDSNTTKPDPNVPVTNVSLNPTSINLGAGRTQTIVAVITPQNATNKGLVWGSNEEAVATVSEDGTITAVSIGTAVISVMTVDEGFTDTCVVTVNQLPPTSITINPASVTLDIGQTQQLTISTTPANANPNVTWSSNNTSIATVSTTGLVTAIGQGQAVITVTSTVAPNVTATRNVTVNPPPAATVTINLISNFSVSGVTVVLENNDENPNNVYTRTAANPVVNFDNIPFGNYTVKITHVNYSDYFYGDLAVQSSAVNHSASLVYVGPVLPGDIITFGAYEWRVLDIEDGRALVVSRNIIEQGVYHTPFASITWANSSLRAYLNGEFYNSFSASDRARIIQVTNVNENNQWLGTNGGSDTQDRIFLLSIAEVVKYFGDSGQLANRPSGAYRINDQYNQNRITSFNGTAFWWWLRSPGLYSFNASYVSIDGIIHMYGDFVDYNYYGVRPALWLNL